MKTLNRFLVGGMVALLGIFPAKTKSQIHGNFSSALKSNYIAKGYVLGKGPHKQDAIVLGTKGFDTIFWSDYDFGRKLLQEIDLGVKYSKNVKGGLSAGVGYLYMWYPEGLADNVPNANLHYQGKINANLNLSWFMKNKLIPNGIVAEVNISRTEEWKNFSITGNLKSILVNNFYRDSGITGISPGIETAYRRNNFLIKAYLSQQFGFIQNPKILPPAKKQLQGGVELTVDF